jgi:hypothetical protein
MLAKPSRRPRHGPRRPGAGAPLGWSRSNACPLRPPVTTFGACTRPGTVDAGGGPVQSTLSCARSRSASPVGGKCGSSPVAADVLTRARTAGHRPGAGTATLAAAFRCRSLADDDPAQLGIQVLGVFTLAAWVPVSAGVLSTCSSARSAFGDGRCGDRWPPPARTRHARPRR